MAETPSDLRRWADAKIRQLEDRMRFLRDAHELHRDPADWARHVAGTSASIASTAEELETLVSYYAAKEKVLPVTTVAGLIGLSRYGVYERLRSEELAAEYRSALGGEGGDAA